jgi:hypothetical protein
MSGNKRSGPAPYYWGTFVLVGPKGRRFAAARVTTVSGNRIGNTEIIISVL